MNQVANTQSTAVASLEGLKTGLRNVSRAIPASTGTPFLRMAKDGIWIYGAEDTEVEKGAQWAVNPFSLRHGYCCWTNYDDDDKKNEKKGEVMVPMTQNKPPAAELPDHGWDWTDQIAVNLKCTIGEDTGTEVLYTTTSRGGLNALKGLIDEITAHLDADQSTPVAVIELNHDTYKHAKYGRTYIPIFTIKAWIGMDGPTVSASDGKATASRSNGSDDAPQASVPVTPTNVASADVAGPESGGDASEAAPEPRRRRRRRSQE